MGVFDEQQESKLSMEDVLSDLGVLNRWTLSRVAPLTLVSNFGSYLPGGGAQA